MSDKIFLLSDQNGALVGHMSFQGKKKYLQPCHGDCVLFAMPSEKLIGYHL